MPFVQGWQGREGASLAEPKSELRDPFPLEQYFGRVMQGAMHTGYASDIEALLRRAGVPALPYRQFRNPPTRCSPAAAPPEDAAETPAAVSGEDDTADVFPVPPIASIRPAESIALPRSGNTGADSGPNALHAPALRRPPMIADLARPAATPDTAIRLPLVEAALGSAPQPPSAEALSTLARLRQSAA